MDCTPSLARDEPSRLFGAPMARTSATRSMPTIRVLPCHAALGTRWLAFTPIAGQTAAAAVRPSRPIAA
jgi:hypothetical protein